jgi:hypothetical protein
VMMDVGGWCLFQSSSRQVSHDLIFCLLETNSFHTVTSAAVKGTRTGGAFGSRERFDIRCDMSLSSCSVREARAWSIRVIDVWGMKTRNHGIRK